MFVKRKLYIEVEDLIHRAIDAELRTDVELFGIINQPYFNIAWDVRSGVEDAIARKANDNHAKRHIREKHNG